MRRAPVVAALLLATLATAAPAEAQLRLGNCPYDTEARCGRLAVPLDPSGGTPGQVRLYVARYRGTRRRPPVLVLSGGPGQSIIHSLGNLDPRRNRAFAERDIVIFDARGTGRSDLLRCPELERDTRLRSTEGAAACAASLGARRAFFTTREAVADIEAVRAALGIRRMAIMGTSWGTRVALAYARAHPDRVERLILDSVVDELDAFTTESYAAIPRVLRAICVGRCQGVTEDPVADVAALVARLRSAPMTGNVADVTGRRTTGTLTRLALLDLLFDADLNPWVRTAIPAAVRSALGGDAVPLLRLARLGGQTAAPPAQPRYLSPALYAASVCEELPFPWERGARLEDRPRQRDERAARLGDAAFHPFDRETAATADVLSLCLRWPHATPGPFPAGGPLPDVPAFLLQGEEDLRTPLEGARRVAERLPRSRLLSVAGIGHSVNGWTHCVNRALLPFLRGGRPARRCPRFPLRIPRVPVLPTRLDDLRPVAGVPGRRGRTLRAIDLTIDDVVLELAATPSARRRGGGLRGGRYRGTRRGLVLDRVVVVPGVTVTARPGRRGTLRLRVGGPAAADGRLLLRRDARITGRLEGRPVRARLRRGPPRGAG